MLQGYRKKVISVDAAVRGPRRFILFESERKVKRFFPLALLDRCPHHDTALISNCLDMT